MPHTVRGQSRVLLMEMYSYAYHNPRVAETVQQWLRQAHSALEAHYSPEASRAIDSLVEGRVMHHHCDAEGCGMSHGAVYSAVAALSQL